MTTARLTLTSHAANGLAAGRNRQPWLDVLRGFAVILVLFNHLRLPAPVALNPFYQCLHAVGLSGWVGVDIFFVLSGFLVSGILFRQYLKTGRIRPWQFLIRRGFKIYPAFWILILISPWIPGVVMTSEATQKVLIELLFIQNYVQGLWIHTWSLAVEEHCYLGLCLLLTMMAWWNQKQRNPFALLPPFIIAVAVAILIGRILHSTQMDPRRTVTYHFYHYTFPTHLRCDTFLYGVLLGYFFYFSNGKFLKICERFRWMFLVAGVVCLAPVLFYRFTGDKIVWTWLFTSNAIGGSFLLMWGLGTRRAPGKLSRFMATIGQHSYSIYLWHVLFSAKLLVWTFLKLKVPGQLYVFVPLYFLVAIGSGMLMSYLIERPALKLRDQFCPEEGRVSNAATILGPGIFDVDECLSRGDREVSSI